MKKILISLFSVFLIIAVSFFITKGTDKLYNKSDKDGLQITKDAINEAIATCYAIDGMYPATFEELKDKSNIVINEDKYAVIYSIFASNLKPEIEIIEKY